MLRRVKIYVNSPTGKYAFKGWRPVLDRLTVGLADPCQCLIHLLLLSITRRVTTTDFRKMVPRALGCWT
jgi:hypothetical protein